MVWQTKDVKLNYDTMASYEYDEAGNRTKVTCGNDTFTDYEYDTDPRYRLEYIRYGYKCTDDDTSEIQGGLHITRDDVGNPLTWAVIR